MNLPHLRELLRNPHCVRAALAHLQQQVIALAVRIEAQPLTHEEVFGCDTQTRAPGRSAVRARQIHQLGQLDHEMCSMSAMAWHARPSPRPMKPIFSLVVALIFTRVMFTPRSAA